MPRARLKSDDGKTSEWKSKSLRAYQRRTKAADALIASTYLAGTNTRRVRRALAALFGGAVGKDTVSRVWRKVKTDWEAWNARSLAEEPIVRLILDGTVVKVRLDRKATSISLLVVIGVREDGQKILLAVKNTLGGETAEAWRSVLDDLVARGLRRPKFLIVDGAKGLDAAIAKIWDGVPVQRCTVHKHRNLLAKAPERLHEEITADYAEMIYAETPQDIEDRRRKFIAKCDPDGSGPLYSQPGPMLWQWTFPPGQFAGRLVTNVVPGEGWLTPPNQYQFPGDSRVYQYDFKINASEAFYQTNGNIYWLDVQARPNVAVTNVLFGWKTSITNWNDDSVWANGLEPWPGPWQELRRWWQPPNYPSIDLAFRLAAELMVEGIKWSQPPVPYTPTNAINGWDEWSIYGSYQIVADV